MVQPHNLRHMRIDMVRTTSGLPLNSGTLRSFSEPLNNLFARGCKAVAGSTTKNIALALQESVALRFSILQGVQDFARTQSDWNLVRSDGSLVVSWRDALAARPDGIIGFVGEENVPSLKKTGIPIVCVNSVHNLSACVKVRSDARAVGSLAANYFLDLGYQEFAYCTDVPFHFYSQVRWEGYSDALQHAGFSAHQIRLLECPSANSKFVQLKDLPAGCAVYCADRLLCPTRIDSLRRLRHLRAATTCCVGHGQ